MRRFSFAIGVMLLLSAVCGARQLPPAKSVPVQHQPRIPLIDHTPTPMPSFEGLVALVAQQIVQKHLKSVVVIGAAGPKVDEPTQFGLELGDKFSVALAKQSKEFQVGERVALREFIRKAGVADAMVVSDGLANWIASKASSEGFIVLKFLNVWENRADVEAILCETDKEDGKFLEASNTLIELSADQYSDGFRAIDSDWNKEAHPGKDGDTLPSDSMPVCAVCHQPEMTEVARKAGHVD